MSENKETQEAPQAEAKAAPCAHDPELPCDLKCDARNECASQLVKSAPVQSAVDIERALCIEMFGDHPDSYVLQARLEKLIAYREAQRQAGRDEAEQSASDKWCAYWKAEWTNDWTLRNNPTLQSRYAAVVEAANGCKLIKEKIAGIERNEDWTGGEPTLGTCRLLGDIKNIIVKVSNALSDLDKAKGATHG